MKSNIPKTTLWVSIVQFDGRKRWIMSTTRDLNNVVQQYKLGDLTYSIPKKVTYFRTLDDKRPEMGNKLIICKFKSRRAENDIHMKNPELNDITKGTSDSETEVNPTETTPVKIMS